MSSEAIVEETLLNNPNLTNKGAVKISALAKTTLREIRRSFGRFISILCLIALGVLAYVGISVAGADMRYTGISYSNDYNLADIFIQSTAGLDASDKETLAAFHDLRHIDYGYSADVTALNAKVKDSNSIADQVTLKLESLPRTLSQYELLSGRLPEKKDEIVLDQSLAQRYGIGDKLRLITTSTIDKSLEHLTQDTFKVVGFANSPEYLSKRMRGTSLTGKGEITGFAGVQDEVFDMDVYTIARAESTLLNRSETETTQYDDQIKAQIKKLDKELNAGDKKNARIDALQRDLQAKIKQGERELANAKRMLGASDERVKRIEGELARASEALAKIEQPTYNLTSRNNLVAYHDFFDNGARLDVLAYIFPVFLFFIAVLVTSTTMKRMVEEQRPQIGALKSLGYRPISIMEKYLIYGMIPGITGTIIGVTFGLTLLPILIYSAYKMSYIFVDLRLRFSFIYVLTGVVVALLCTLLPIIFAVHASLKEKTIALLRPKVAKAGKRILLERIPFIWRHLSFTAKVTARNIFRYKERMFMTILGIAGSIALLIMGIGIRDALGATLDIQLNQIYRYDIMTRFNPESSDAELQAYDSVIHNNNSITHALQTIFDNVEVKQQETDNKALSLIVPEQPEALHDYIELFDSNNNPIVVPDTGIALSQDLAETLGVNIGDEIELLQKDEVYRAHVGVINQWYFGNQAVLTPKYYKKVFGKNPTYDAYFLKLDEKGDRQQVLFDLQNTAANMYASTLDGMVHAAKGSVDGLNLVMGVLLSLASLLAVIVLYNLTNINISERIREISTIKVLGFYPSEVTRYIYRETLILTVMGIIVGWFLGTALEQFVIIKIPPEQVMFYRKIFWTNYAISSLIILAIAFCVMLVMHLKLKRVNMLDALKSVE
jgi:putative ABC transport system permease protein